MTFAAWQATIVTDAGDVVPGAQITVINEATNTTATIFNTRTGTGKSNPFFADAEGFAQFYAAPGEYRIDAVDGLSQTIRTWRYVSLSVGQSIVYATGSGLPNEAGTVYTLDIGQLLAKDYFSKTVKNTPLFNKTGNFTVSTNQVFYVEVGGLILTIASGTVVSMPSATTGTDYAIWLKPDGTLQATSNHTTPPATGARKIGGFHYAPGGNATGQSGGNSTPQINEYSFWDLKYKPACDDPRGMTCVAGTFWSDIYLLNNNPDVYGTSRFGRPIADGSTPPIIPAALGGNGSTTYGSLTWFEAMSISAVYGKSAFTQPEFMAAMYGVTEATSRGTDPGSTGLDAARTSKWGVMQATGNLWTWAQDRGGPFAGASWNANTEGFGSEFNAPNASLLGANWFNGSLAGSRSSLWSDSASVSAGTVSLRCRADHLQLD